MNLFAKILVTLRNLANHPLHRNAKAKAVIDFCLVQVAVRLVPGDICVPFPNDTKLLISPRMKGAAHFIRPGLCEFEEMCFVLHFLRADDLFIDIGANVGAYTILASGAVGARTLAFEPSPFSFRYLVQNVRLNDLGAKATPLNLALGSAEGVLHLTEGLGTENYVSPTGASASTTQVRVTTLDTALAGLHPAVIKLDVEGFEHEVIEGAGAVFANPSVSALIVERMGNAVRYGYDEAALHHRIQQQAFIPCAYQPFQRVLSRLPADAQGNLIYVRDVQAAQERLRNSPTFSFADATI